MKWIQGDLHDPRLLRHYPNTRPCRLTFAALGFRFWEVRYDGAPNLNAHTMDNLTTVDPSQATFQRTHVLSKDGYTCTLLHINPGDENPDQEGSVTCDHLLFVIEGDITVSDGEVYTVVGKDQALLVKGGKPCLLSSERNAKVLRIDVPARVVTVPQILTR